MENQINILEELRLSTTSSINQCIDLVRNQDENSSDIVITRIESILSAISAVQDQFNIPWGVGLVAILENVINCLEQPTSNHIIRRGRPSFEIPSHTLEFLLSMNFKVPEISQMIGVSRGTIFRRLSSYGLSVAQTYSNITNETLGQAVLTTLINHPNTGYKRMKGFLAHQGIKVADQRVREVMRLVDPIGVYYRTLENRAIVRRQYFVKFSNEIWHLDGNLKLIRWGIVIRCGIDGKSRTATYLEATNNNRADTHLLSFLQGVSTYGLPSRTRSDKGGENVLIAKYMIEKRGTGRASHICGRSVHNQRIERFWRDVFYGCASFFYNVFTALEDNGVLNIDNVKHLELLHRVFLPRLNRNLTSFMNGWNRHPLSTESNHSPSQLFFLNLPPINMDFIPEMDHNLLEYFCNGIEDLEIFGDLQGIMIPQNLPETSLTDAELQIFELVDPLKNSDLYGYDIFVEALKCLQD